MSSMDQSWHGEDSDEEGKAVVVKTILSTISRCRRERKPLFGAADRTVERRRGAPDTRFGGRVTTFTTISEHHEGLPLTRSGNPPS